MEDYSRSPSEPDLEWESIYSDTQRIVNPVEDYYLDSYYDLEDESVISKEWDEIIARVQKDSVRKLWSPAQKSYGIIGAAKDDDHISSPFQFPDTWKILYEDLIRTRHRLNQLIKTQDESRQRNLTFEERYLEPYYEEHDEKFISPLAKSVRIQIHPEPEKRDAYITSDRNISINNYPNQNYQSSSITFPNVAAPDFRPSSSKRYIPSNNNSGGSIPVKPPRRLKAESIFRSTSSYPKWTTSSGRDANKNTRFVFGYETERFNGGNTIAQESQSGIQNQMESQCYYDDGLPPSPDDDEFQMISPNLTQQQQYQQRYTRRIIRNRSAFLRAMDVYTYTTEKMQAALSECSFVIQLLSSPQGQNDRPTFNSLPRCFKAVYADPTGCEHSAYIRNSPTLKNTFFGMFYPTIPGCYQISVFILRSDHDGQSNGGRGGRASNRGIGAQRNENDDNRDHVYGSPFAIKICRNYPMDSRKVILRIGLYGMINSGTNPGRCWGVASDEMTDNIFVTNREKHTVSGFNSTGQFLYKFGVESDVKFSRNGQSLFRPTGIVCDSFNRRLLVADKDNHRIAIYSLDGSYLSSFGHVGFEDGSFNYPWDVDCSFNGDRIIVSDSKNHRVQLFDKFGNFLKKYTLPINSIQNLLETPRGISFDQDSKNIYVTDYHIGTITKINGDFKSAVKLRSEENQDFHRLQGLSVDNVGNILVCETRRNVLRILRPNGEILSTIGTLESTPLHKPLDVTLLKGGAVVVLDFDGRVRVF